MKTLSSYSLRGFRPSDRSGVGQLLADIGDKYPNGRNWLDSRLDDSLLGKASTWILADMYNSVRGIVILSPKGQTRSKLSTIKLDPVIRGMGIGTFLLHEVSKFWLRSDVENAAVTINAQNYDTINFFQNRADYKYASQVDNLYGIERNELIFNWSPAEAYELIHAHTAHIH